MSRVSATLDGDTSQLYTLLSAGKNHHVVPSADGQWSDNNQTSSRSLNRAAFLATFDLSANIQSIKYQIYFN